MTNPSPEIIERVARAMCIHVGVNPDNPDGIWTSFVGQARAAIAAMPQSDPWLQMRPMSEAPRDGTSILVWMDHAIWGRDDWRIAWCKDAAWRVSDCTGRWSDDCMAGWWPLPPLPSPPAASKPDLGADDGLPEPRSDLWSGWYRKWWVG